MKTRWISIEFCIRGNGQLPGIWRGRFMNLILLALPLFCQAQAMNCFQDSDTTDLRFYRVHLRNGNFIDGELVKDTANEVLLRLKVGEMAIRRDQIEKVEFVKMKSTNTGAIYRPDPRKEPPKDPPAEALRDPVKNPIADKIPAEVRKKVDQMVLKLRTTPGDEKSFP